jgi:uncharacterized protein YjbI with pentapeptide repeats
MASASADLVFTLTTAQLTEAYDFTGATFVGCDLRDITMGQHKFANSDFGSAKLQGSSFTNLTSVLGKKWANAVLRAETVALHGQVRAATVWPSNADFSRADFQGADLIGYTSAAGHIWQFANITGATLSDSVDEAIFTNVSAANSRGIRGTGLIQNANNKLTTAELFDGGNTTHAILANGNLTGPEVDVRNYDFDDKNVGTPNLSASTFSISSDTNPAVNLIDLQADDYLDIGGVRYTAALETRPQHYGVALANFANLHKSAIPQVTDQMWNKSVTGITDTSIGMVKYEEGSWLALKFWLMNLTQTNFQMQTDGVTDRTVANVMTPLELAAAKLLGNVAGGVHWDQDYGNITQEPFLVGDLSLSSNGTIVASDGSTGVSGSSINNGGTDTFILIADAARSAYSVGQRIKFSTEIMVIKAFKDAGSGNTELEVLRAQEGTTVVTLTTTANAFDPQNYLLYSEPLLTIASSAAVSGKSYTTMRISHKTYANDGLKLQRIEGTPTFVGGYQLLTIYKKLSKYQVKAWVGPHQDLRYLKDYHAGASDTTTSTTRYEIDGLATTIILDGCKFGDATGGIKLDVNTQESFRDCDFENCILDAGNASTGCFAGAKYMNRVNLKDAKIRVQASTNVVWRTDFYAKGIKGDLAPGSHENVTYSAGPHSLYTAPFDGNGCLYGPGVDLTGCNFSGQSGAVLDLSAASRSLEEANLSGVIGGIAHVKFASVKNADFSSKSLSVCQFNGSIAGAKFVGITANGTAAQTDSRVEFLSGTAVANTEPQPNFSSAQLDYAKFDGNLVGVGYSAAEAGDVAEKRINMKSASLKNSEWNAQNNQYIDFTGASLNKAKFQNAAGLDATGSLFKNANLSGVVVADTAQPTVPNPVVLARASLEGATIGNATDGALNFSGMADAVANTLALRANDMIYAGSNATAVTAMFKSTLTSAVKVSSGKFTLLPIKAASAMDLENVEVHGTADAKVTIPTAANFGVSMMKNMSMKFCVINGITLEHDDGSIATAANARFPLAEPANAQPQYLEKFQIQNCDIQTNGLTVVQANTADTRLLYGSTTVITANGDVPSGATDGTTMRFTGVDVFDATTKQSATAVNNAKMTGKDLDNTGINFSGMDLGASGVKYTNIDFSGASMSGATYKQTTVPAAVAFSGCKLPTGYKEISSTDTDTGTGGSQPGSIVIGPNMSYLNATIIPMEGFTFDDADLTGSVFNKCTLTSNSFRNCNLSGVDFHASKLDSINIRGATVNSSTDLSDITSHLAAAKITGIDIVGTGMKLITDETTANVNYTLNNGELVAKAGNA